VISARPESFSASRFAVPRLGMAAADAAPRQKKTSSSIRNPAAIFFRPLFGRLSMSARLPQNNSSI
jgi:hypothetical protein